MKYLVDEEFLREYKRMFEKYADHLPSCDIVASRNIFARPELDFAQCTCGFSPDIKQLREESSKVKEHA